MSPCVELSSELGLVFSSAALDLVHKGEGGAGSWVVSWKKVGCHTPTGHWDPPCFEGTWL